MRPFIYIYIYTYMMVSKTARDLILFATASLLVPSFSMGHNGETHEGADKVTFKSAFCGAGPLQTCDTYVEFVYYNSTNMSYALSDAVGDGPLDIVDAAQADKVLATLVGRNGTLESVEDGQMDVMELGSHFCMGHIFINYDDDLYRVDPVSGGCDQLMSMDPNMDMEMDMGATAAATMDPNMGATSAPPASAARALLATAPLALLAAVL